MPFWGYLKEENGSAYDNSNLSGPTKRKFNQLGINADFQEIFDYSWFKISHFWHIHISALGMQPPIEYLDSSKSSDGIP